MCISLASALKLRSNLYTCAMQTQRALAVKTRNKDEAWLRRAPKEKSSSLSCTHGTLMATSDSTAQPCPLPQFYSSPSLTAHPHPPHPFSLLIKQSTERPPHGRFHVQGITIFVHSPLGLTPAQSILLWAFFPYNMSVSQNVEPALRKLNRTREAMCPTIKGNTSSSNRSPTGQAALPKGKCAAGKPAKCPWFVKVFFFFHI